MDVRQLAGALGAEVRGIDLSDADLDPAVVHDLLGEHHAIFFPDQQLAPQDLVRLLRTFGEPLVHPYLKSLPGAPQVHELRKTPSDVVNFGNLWHTDFTNLPHPSLANALYSIEVPDFGGDTLIASTVAAFEALSPGMQTMLHTREGAKPVTVLKVGASVIDVDLNHPMAGETVTFNIEVLAVREAESEEVLHGHPHGPGGHQH